MMRVLVTAASKHGATSQIAEVIARRLAERGTDVVQRLPGDVTDLEGFDAVVLGSAVYAGRWPGAATGSVGRFGTELHDRRVWVLTSGPLGEPPKPEQDPIDAAPMLEATAARDQCLLLEPRSGRAHRGSSVPPAADGDRDRRRAVPGRIRRSWRRDRRC